MSTPTGPVSLPPYKLRRMVALSPTFQAACTTANYATAWRNTYFKEAAGTELRPCAVVNHEDLSYRLIAGGSQNHLRAQGTMFLWLARNVAPADLNDPAEALNHFADFFGAVMDEVAALAGVDQTADATVPDSHLTITGIQGLLIAMNDQSEWATLGQFCWGAAAVSWGDGE